jgi:hypothetical protein
MQHFFSLLFQTGGCEPAQDYCFPRVLRQLPLGVVQNSEIQTSEELRISTSVCSHFSVTKRESLGIQQNTIARYQRGEQRSKMSTIFRPGREQLWMVSTIFVIPEHPRSVTKLLSCESYFTYLFRCLPMSFDFFSSQNYQTRNCKRVSRNEMTRGFECVSSTATSRWKGIEAIRTSYFLTG